MADPIVTISGLMRKMDDELSWRRKELHVIRNIIPNVPNPLQRAMLRSAIPLLYAHWEGFIKVATSYYLEHVSKKYLKHNELVTRFVALSLQNKLASFSNNPLQVKSKIVDFVIHDLATRSNIPKSGVINTKSNLRFDVLKEILYLLDLDDPSFDSKERLVNDLVDTRNFIAHGEFKVLDLETYDNLFLDILNLMEQIKTAIENNAALEKYKVAKALV
jgi:hypothetical protein